MFESDDYDQVLSQLQFPDTIGNTLADSNFNQNTNFTNIISNFSNSDNTKDVIIKDNLETQKKTIDVVSPKHAKRKIIDSHFDPKNKRKFPGPAGLLNGNLEETHDDSISHMELLSQDIEYNHNARKDLFESPLWLRLLSDMKTWKLCNVNSIKTIKQQALAGNLQKRKAQIVTAFVDSVDRSVSDPLIILRDASGTIKCTLHRDAWTRFSPYIVSEYCVLVLWKPTVLTTGSAFKKHYLNITLSNIYAIFSTAVLKEEDMSIPEGYSVICEDYTVIKLDKSIEDLDSKTLKNGSNEKDTSDILDDDLDNLFADDLF